MAELRNLSVDGKYLLVNDLDIGGAEWIPIGSSSSPFSGIFDGNNHTISNFKRTGDYSIAGLFGYNTGVIKNITVDNFTIDLDYSSYSPVSSRYVGGLVGYNDGGIISNCNVSGSISVYSKTDYRDSYAGGLAGYNSGVIENSYSMAGVSVRSTSERNTSYAGGLVGYNIGTITNCYATKSVSASAGYGTSYSYAGGLVGENWGGMITNCYTTGSVSAGAYTEYSSDTSYNRCYSYSYAGGLAGYSSGGTITNCYTTS